METTGNIGGRPRDSFADPHIIVVKKDNVIAKQCKYCHNLFSNKISVTRIKAHLGGVPGQGVAPCKKVPSNVKEDARNAMSSTRKDARNAMSRSNNNSRTDAFLLCSPSIGDMPRNRGTQLPPLHECCTSSSLPPQIMPLVQEKWPWLLDDSLQQSNVDSTCLEVQLDTPGSETVVLESLRSQQDMLGLLQDDFESTLGCSHSEHEHLDTTQLCKHDEAYLLQETLRSQETSSMGIQHVFESLQMNPSPSLALEFHDMDIVHSPTPFDIYRTQSKTKLEKKRKIPNRNTPIGKKIPLSRKFQGPTFNAMVSEICASLEDDSISRLGVYGMGGSGKTTIMKHIHNLLLEECFMPFSHVIWVTLSQDLTVSKLQGHLASMLGLTLTHGEDQVTCATTLYEKMENMCYVLILDDVWDSINLEEVGIPEPSLENRCKIILTTRLLDVCNRMNCNRALFLDLLSKEEAWELFVKTSDVTPENSIIESIMKEVAKECARLPLAIITVATSMRGILDIHEWRNALVSIRNRTYGFIEMEKVVMEKLKFSYHRLSKQLQKCLLNCALYPEDFPIRREELIEMLIMEGTIESTESRLSAYDHGHTILNKLENACLLISHNDSLDCVVMHDLIRDMCLDIIGGRFLVKCGSKFPPNESKYTEDVEKVSLIGSKFKEIPSLMAPYCPKLSTLLLSKNRKLIGIADSFFTAIPMLEVLNLSDTSIRKLPYSLTNLVNLKGLVLNGCTWLKRLPCLASLKALRKLDLSFTAIEEAPEGLEELVNLTYLDLNLSAIKMLPSLIPGNLVKLQYLKLPSQTKVTMDDVKELKNLETFQAVFANLKEFNEYVSSVLNSGQGPSVYDVRVYCNFMSYGICRDIDGKIEVLLCGMKDERRKEINCTKSMSPQDVSIIFPPHENIEVLFIEEVGDNCDVLLKLNGEAPLSLHILKTRLHHEEQTEESGELKDLCDGKLIVAFPSLKSLCLRNCNFIEELISTSPSIGMFSYSLKHLSIDRCDKLVRLVSPKILSVFENLEVIEIEGCKSLKSIASAATSTKKEESNSPISLSKLRLLKLRNLPNLRSIYGSTLICPSIKHIKVRWCPKLKRLPLHLQVVDNNRGQLSSPPQSLVEIKGHLEWWESLEWDHPYAKALLQPYFNPYPRWCNSSFFC